MFGKSMKSMHAEVARLRAEADARALELVADGIDSGQLIQALMPINRRIAALRVEIRNKTPWKKLVARRDAVQTKLALLSTAPSFERSQLLFELTDLDHYLQSSRFSRRRPMTLKSVLIFAAIIAAMLVGPQLIVNWLVP